MKLARLVKAAVTQTDWGRLKPSRWDRTKLLVPFRMITHPIETCEEVQWGSRGSLMIANTIAILYFLLHLFSASSTGFIFNTTGGKINVWGVLLSTVGIILLWCVSSWSLSTLMDGEGRFSTIYILTCYSMFPDVLCRLPLIGLSNVITMEEYSLIAIIEAIVTFISFVLLFLSTMVVQQYTVKKTVILCVLSAVGIAAILFMAVLLFSLFQQFYIFLQTVWTEAMFRV